jgi:transposase-like protein
MTYHPAYGLPAEYRLQVLAALPRMSVAEAATRFNLATSTIYRWRRDLA